MGAQKKQEGHKDKRAIVRHQMKQFKRQSERQLDQSVECRGYERITVSVERKVSDMR
jgi:hypothetical protein